MTKKICATVCFILCMAIMAPAFAIDIQPYASDVISNAYCTISNNGTQITAKAVISAVNKASKIGAVSFAIQEKRNGSWVSVKSVTAKYVYNAYDFSYTLTYAGNSDYEYRAIATLTATVNGKTETRYPVSATI